MLCLGLAFFLAAACLWVCGLGGVGWGGGAAARAAACAGTCVRVLRFTLPGPEGRFSHLRKFSGLVRAVKRVSSGLCCCGMRTMADDVEVEEGVSRSGGGDIEMGVVREGEERRGGADGAGGGSGDGQRGRGSAEDSFRRETHFEERAGRRGGGRGGGEQDVTTFDEAARTVLAGVLADPNIALSKSGTAGTRVREGRREGRGGEEGKGRGTGRGREAIRTGVAVSARDV